MPIARSLFCESKKLRVFDLDDTLVKTSTYVIVNHKNGLKSKLTPGQFAIYKEKPGDVFDYSEFQQIRNPVLIKGYVELLKRMADGSGDRGVFILTARSAQKPIEDFIRDIGIRNVTVVALGDANPEKKADWIENAIQSDKYDDVFFVDDSPKNVEAVRRRLRNYKNVKQQIQLVKSKD